MVDEDLRGKTCQSILEDDRVCGRPAVTKEFGCYFCIEHASVGTEPDREMVTFETTKPQGQAATSIPATRIVEPATAESPKKKGRKAAPEPKPAAEVGEELTPATDAEGMQTPPAEAEQPKPEFDTQSETPVVTPPEPQTAPEVEESTPVEEQPAPEPQTALASMMPPEPMEEVAPAHAEASELGPRHIRWTITGRPAEDRVRARFVMTALDRLLQMLQTAVSSNENVDETLLLVGLTSYPLAIDLQYEEESGIPAAIDAAIRLIQSAPSSDDQLAHAASSMSPAAVAAVGELLSFLHEHQAGCTLALARESVTLAAEEVETLARLIGPDNLKTQHLSLEGSFEGVLPRRRTFEFQTNDDEIVVGEVGPTIEDPSEINRVVGQRSTAEVVTVCIADRPPRSILVGYHVLEPAV